MTTLVRSATLSYFVDVATQCGLDARGLVAAVGLPARCLELRLGRLREPLIKPGENEREGYVPNVVYSCGSLLHGRQLVIPYAMSDYATTFATVPLDEVLAAME